MFAHRGEGKEGKRFQLPDARGPGPVVGGRAWKARAEREQAATRWSGSGALV